MLQVPFFICRYLLLNIQVPFSTRQQAIHGTVLFTPDLLTPHTAFPSLPATVSVFWNVSTHFFYPCAYSVVASSTWCHLNRRKLNTYRATCPPSWENGTWQVPSQLSHSDNSIDRLRSQYNGCHSIDDILIHILMKRVETFYVLLQGPECLIDTGSKLVHVHIMAWYRTAGKLNRRWPSSTMSYSYCVTSPHWITVHINRYWIPVKT